MSEKQIAYRVGNFSANVHITEGTQRSTLADIFPANNNTIVNEDAKSTLKILYTNADCLGNKMEELLTVLEETKPDVVAITEFLAKNRTQSTTSGAVWHIQGYTTFIPNLENYDGRGCVIYTKESLEAFEVEVKGINKTEHITIGICCSNNQKLLMSCVYRSPSITDPEIIPELNKLFNLKVSDKNRYDLRLILGDFNIKEINWESGTTSTSETHISTQFLEAFRD